MQIHGARAVGDARIEARRSKMEAEMEAKRGKLEVRRDKMVARGAGWRPRGPTLRPRKETWRPRGPHIADSSQNVETHGFLMVLRERVSAASGPTF